MTAPAVDRSRPIVVVGGAGFIGSNLAWSLLADGHAVRVIDNLSRAGVEANVAWLQAQYGARLEFVEADIRDLDAIAAPLADAAAVFQLAAQTAVTTSLADPLDDFRVNALGTLHVLEAVRRSGRRTPVIFASTNKVYGGLETLRMTETDERYVPLDLAVRTHGVAETQGLDFSTPYGCSKGVADQYVLDYAESFGLPTAVLRMSCIYGPRQFGTEDQGWVAHFLIQALQGAPITIFGNGKQVRDVLFVDDAVAAYRAVLDGIEQISGRVFNLGGGPANAVSLRQVLGEIGRLTHMPQRPRFEAWRQGDQPWFVADTRRLAEAVAWRPRVGWRDGLRRLADWLIANRAPGADTAMPRRATA